MQLLIVAGDADLFRDIDHSMHQNKLRRYTVKLPLSLSRVCPARRRRHGDRALRSRVFQPFVLAAGDHRRQQTGIRAC